MTHIDRVITPKSKVWIKPALDVTAIAVAAYYHVSSTDQGAAEHRS